MCKGASVPCFHYDCVSERGVVRHSAHDYEDRVGSFIITAISGGESDLPV